jgi:hypothetical protein
VGRRGKTQVLSAEEARKPLDSIETTTLIGLRDRALIGTMVTTASPGGRDGDDAAQGLFSASQTLVS